MASERTARLHRSQNQSRRVITKKEEMINGRYSPKEGQEAIVKRAFEIPTLFC
jgi:hypothetical protein